MSIKNFVKSVFFQQPIPHPFTKKGNVNILYPDKLENVKGVENVKWGNELKTATVKHKKDSISWDLSDDKKGQRLKATDLDEFDWQEIRKSKINPASYKLTKPYILAGWKYKEIGIVLGYSTRWIQDIGPAVKRGMNARRGGV